MLQAEPRFPRSASIAGGVLALAGFAQAVVGFIMWLVADCGPNCTSSAAWASVPGLALGTAGLVLLVVGGVVWLLGRPHPQK